MAPRPFFETRWHERYAKRAVWYGQRYHFVSSYANRLNVLKECSFNHLHTKDPELDAKLTTHFGHTLEITSLKSKCLWAPEPSVTSRGWVQNGENVFIFLTVQLCVFAVVPVRKVHALNITWALPPQEKHYRWANKSKSTVHRQDT